MLETNSNHGDDNTSPSHQAVQSNPGGEKAAVNQQNAVGALSMICDMYNSEGSSDTSLSPSVNNAAHTSTPAPVSRTSTSPPDQLDTVPGTLSPTPAQLSGLGAISAAYQGGQTEVMSDSQIQQRVTAIDTAFLAAQYSMRVLQQGAASQASQTQQIQQMLASTGGDSLEEVHWQDGEPIDEEQQVTGQALQSSTDVQRSEGLPQRQRNIEKKLQVMSQFIFSHAAVFAIRL